MTDQTPQKGEYYYHYKHDPDGPVENYAYRVEGIAFQTETEEKLVLYAPLYNSDHLKSEEVDVYARPLSMFVEEVRVGDETVPRFQKIEDQVIIEELTG